MAQQLFTTTDGKTARLKGPILIDGIERFDKTEYPIHSDKPIEAGEFSGELVWQFYYRSPDGWKWGSCYESSAKEMVANKSYDVRQAVQPVPVRGKENIVVTLPKTDWTLAIEKAIQAAHAVPEYFAGEKEQKYFIEILTKMIK